MSTNLTLNIPTKEETQIFSDRINSNIMKVKKSGTLLLNEISKKLEAEGKRVYKFGFGQSPFPPHSSIISALKDGADKSDYANVQGIPDLLKAVANFHKKIDKIDADPKNIIIGPGSKILFYSLFKVFEKANVLIPSPAWVSYEPQVKLVGHNSIRLYTTFENKWRVTPQMLDQECSKLDKDIPIILIMNYPGNPDGLTYNESELKDLTQVLRKHKVLVISDEIYALMHHKNEHLCFGRFYPEGSIIANGLSKWCGAGGWRLGTLVLPETLAGDFKDSLLGYASETYSCVATPIQAAAVKAYDNIDNISDYLAYQRKILSTVGNMSVDILRESGIRVHAPEGGFYIYIDFENLREKLAKKGITDSLALCAKALEETGAAILSGKSFGSKAEDLVARLSYVDFDGAKTLEAAQKYSLNQEFPKEFINEYCEKTIEGCQKLADWAKSL